MNRRALNLLFALMFVGCGIEEVTPPADPSTDEVLEAEDELSTKAPSFVTVRRDFRKCSFPMCGGYWVEDVNRTVDEQYVYDFNFQNSGLDANTQGLVKVGLDQIVVRGKLSRRNAQGFRRFIVYEAYRGLPGITPNADAKFYSVSETLIQCIKAPCDNLAATELNIKNSESHFAELNVWSAIKPFVDQAWAQARVLQGQALVAGSVLEMAYDGVDGPGAPIKTLDATQIYFRLPEVAGPCPMVKMAACASGTSFHYSRSADRCVLPSGCSKPAYCTLAIPACPAGYALAAWKGKGGCPQYACDPAWAGRQSGGTVYSATPE